MHCLQIAIFTLDTVKITKRFACANKQRAQQTGALPTELTRQWSNLGSGSHGQLFCLWKTLWWAPPPPPTFRQAPPPLLFRYITENSFFYGDQLRKYRAEQKSWADFLFRSFVNRQKKRQQIGFRVRAKTLCFLGELLFEEIVGYDASVSVSVQLCKHAWSKPSWLFSVI